MRKGIRPALATSTYIAMLFSLSGCNQSNRPATFPVHGKVTYRGQPVADASVTFITPGASRAATGTTDESGNFQLTTFEHNDGAIAGTHDVTVKKYEHEPPPLPQAPASGQLDPAVEARFTADMARWQKTARFAVPKKYTDRKTSDLHLKVAPHENDLEVKLVD
jgi:hypothetical protein